MALNRKKQTVYEGAFVLMLGGILVKIIGAVFKLPLQNLIGSNGSAYFSVAYDIYTWMYILTTAGLPVAISRMVSSHNAKGDYGDSKRTLSAAYIAFMVFGVACSVAMFFGAGFLADLLKSPLSKYAIMAIAPSIVFEVIMACYNGFYQGHKNMIPTAVSQIIIAVVKLVAGILFAWQIMEHMKGSEMAVPYAAAGAIAGVTLATFLGSIYLFFSSRELIKDGRENELTKPTRRKTLLYNLLQIAIPVTIGASVLSITNLVDTAMLFRRLQTAGFSQFEADRMYGYYGWARTMFNLPTAVIVPLGVAVIPAIAEYFTLKKYDKAKLTVDSTLRIASILSIPSGMGLAVLAKPILTMLYPAQYEDAVLAAPLLTKLGPAVILVCFVSITNALLQALGKERVPIITMLIGGTVKVICNYTLVGIPSININGAPVGTNLCYGIITVLNLVVLSKTIGKGIDVMGALVKPFIASALCCAGAYYTYNLTFGSLGNAISALVAMCVAGVMYLAFIFIFKALRREDVKLFPKGEKIEKILDKYGWIG